jgi:acetoin utilization deacetylase AcuC-like enzyme
MFRIRRVYGGDSPEDRAAITQVQDILREQFGGIGQSTIDELPHALREPPANFRPILFVAERTRGVRGFSLLRYAADLHFCFLDYISAARERTGGGIGGALYARVRDEALALHCVGIFMEALPDDPALCPRPELLRQNAARLQFYERYGVRPLAGTAYETPVNPGDSCPPYLLYDDLGVGRPLRRALARKVVRAILQRKYPELCPDWYVDMIVSSIGDDPVQLRPPRYLPESAQPNGSATQPGRRIALVITDRHAIHHVRERGYVEAPVRIHSITRELDHLDLFDRIEPRTFAESHISAVHAPEYVAYLKRVCAGLDSKASVYPYVFPIRNAARPPRDLAIRAGYYCIDTFTPLNRNAYDAARRAVDVTLTAAQLVLEGRPLAYALVRPPGHHAEHRAFGGFCYFNNSAIAAHYMSSTGRVAILDIDYHHGNGQQEIFLSRADVLTLSIHGDPSFAYPYFSGFGDEHGEGEGVSYNINMPLPERVDGERYRRTLGKALRAIQHYRPEYLIVALGLDTAKGDPTGSWSLTAQDFQENGKLIGALGLPTLVVQEGGYRTTSLGVNARRFLQGVWEGKYGGRVDVARERPRTQSGA